MWREWQSNRLGTILPFVIGTDNPKLTRKTPAQAVLATFRLPLKSRGRLTS